MFKFFTPAVARLAYEQTAAWYMTEINKQATVPPARIESTWVPRYRHILEKSGIDLRDLVIGGYVRYVDNDQHIIAIDMQKLYDAAQIAPPRPHDPQATVARTVIPRPRQLLKL